MALGAPSALAQQPVVVAQNSAFSPTEPTIQQGELLALLNQDFVPHDLTHGPGVQPILFASPTFSGPNQQRDVEGTQFLGPGSYPFYCTVHEFMTGTLQVEGGDGTTPPPPPPPPRIEVELGSKKLKKVVNSRKLKATVEALPPVAATDVSLKAVALGKRIARKRGLDVASGEERRIGMKLTKRGRKALKKRLEKDKRAKVKLVGTVPGGERDVDRGTLK